MGAVRSFADRSVFQPFSPRCEPALPSLGILRRTRVPKNAGFTAAVARATCALPPAGPRGDYGPAGSAPLQTRLAPENYICLLWMR